MEGTGPPIQKLEPATSSSGKGTSIGNKEHGVFAGFILATEVKQFFEFGSPAKFNAPQIVLALRRHGAATPRESRSAP